MSLPLVSLIVPSRGGARRSPVLLNALRAQTSAAWEAIIVIDGDIDGSTAIVDAASLDLPVRRITFDVNRGRAAALNAGFAAARGGVMVRCDDDLVPRPDYVVGHLEAHSDREVGVVGLYRNSYPETTYARVYGRDWDLQFRRDAYSAPRETSWKYWAGNVSVTRQLCERVGSYDESYRSYGWEDVDWGYRLASLGVPIVLDTRLETEHRIAATTSAVRALRAFYSGAARTRFELKHSIQAHATLESTSWNRMVSLLAPTLDEKRIQRLGRAVDASARLLPDDVAGKAVAMLVEASARAGHGSGNTLGEI